ncbi:MAG: hypothetical protein GF411_19920 [Candidatus Lokiarchaeota archaeon]|nr:hypothetical protein [Candidatus Lokiarchaeota archaeon]
MDIKKRNEILANDYLSGKTLQYISDSSGLSKSQLSRIFRELGVKRKKYELDKDYFDSNKNKTARQISEETGISIKRVMHLKRIASGAKISKGKTDFTDCDPTVDPGLINNHDWLYEQYVTNKLGAPSIAKMLGSKCSTIYKMFKRFGISRRNISQAMEVKKKWPSKDWLEDHYNNSKWSVERCSVEFGTNWEAIYEALKHYNIPLRDASTQHRGNLNEFYGMNHNEETKIKCAKIGSKYGAEYWTTGDVEEKKRLTSEISKKVWSDPLKRHDHSVRITELCKQGKCNAKNITYISYNGDIIKMKSSWELLTAQILDKSDVVVDWKYEDLSIKYHDGDHIRNFIVDFWVKWKDGLESYIECKNQHLLIKEGEQLKIKTLQEYCDRHGFDFILIDSKEQIKKMSMGYKDMVQWINSSRYKVKRKYLQEPVLFVRMMFHDIINHICPWKPLQYEDDELAKDIDRLKNENLDGYNQNDGLHSTAPNSGGMPGRIIMTHFNPHFWDVPPKNSRPLPHAFDDKKLILKCLNISYKEKESLSVERLLREINFHSKFGRTSHFAPGFARNIIKLMDASGKRIFDPCCGWGGRLLGSWLEECEYSGCDISPLTFNGLLNISNFVGHDCDIFNESCLDHDWPDSDLIFTSPPFYDIEQYIGGNQPWMRCKSRNEWIETFVEPFVNKINSNCVLYLDHKTKDDYESIRKFNKIIEIKNRRHARRKVDSELLCIY